MIMIMVRLELNRIKATNNMFSTVLFTYICTGGEGKKRRKGDRVVFYSYFYNDKII